MRDEEKIARLREIIELDARIRESIKRTLALLAEHDGGGPRKEGAS